MNLPINSDDDKEIQILEQIFRELQNHPPVILQLSAQDAWVFIGMFQLAFRHPSNTGRIAESVKNQIMLMCDSMQLSPVAKEWLNRGWNPDFDKQVQKFGEFIQVKANDFILQSVALDIAVSVAALASSSDKDEMFSQVTIQAKNALSNMTEEQRTDGLKEYYKALRSEK
ncbi:MAG: hypothetical protein WBF90_21935 [Rivularia sp. (in: cyanobacteria)]